MSALNGDVLKRASDLKKFFFFLFVHTRDTCRGRNAASLTEKQTVEAIFRLSLTLRCSISSFIFPFPFSFITVHLIPYIFLSLFFFFPFAVTVILFLLVLATQRTYSVRLASWCFFSFFRFLYVTVHKCITECYSDKYIDDNIKQPSPALMMLVMRHA